MAPLADSIFEFFSSLFGGLGFEGVLLTLFAVFFVDSTLFPLVPEAFVILFYSLEPYLSQSGPLGWGLIILTIVVVAEALANAALFLVIRWKAHRIPGVVKRAMNRWRGLLILQDERAILMNRIIPIMPFMGAFIAVSPWQPRRAFEYVVLGGMAKYAALLVIVGSLQIVDVTTARRVMLLLIIGLVLWGLVSSYLWKRRHKEELAHPPTVPALDEP